jgi:magnesium transporter
VFRRFCCGAPGLLLAFIGLVRIHLWQWLNWTNYTEHYSLVGLAVAGALVGVVLWGSVVGSMLPFVLRKLGLDPAVVSAPFVATLVDVTGLVIYFSVAFLILHGTLL